MPFEEEAARRSRVIEVESDAVLRLCPPEDLIVMKAFADRLQDQPDVQRILIRQELSKSEATDIQNGRLLNWGGLCCKTLTFENCRHGSAGRALVGGERADGVLAECSPALRGA